MFSQFTLPVQQVVLGCMSQSPYQFTLTGSRYFMAKRLLDTTDYDFFIDFSEEVAAELTNLGFVKCNASTYNSSDIVVIYRHLTARIDVQLVADAQVKEGIQKQILESFSKGFLANLTKESWTSLWNFAYEMRRIGFLKG